MKQDLVTIGIVVVVTVHSKRSGGIPIGIGELDINAQCIVSLAKCGDAEGDNFLDRARGGIGTTLNDGERINQRESLPGWHGSEGTVCLPRRVLKFTLG